jgi:hypothetical protein
MGIKNFDFDIWELVLPFEKTHRPPDNPEFRKIQANVAEETTTWFGREEAEGGFKDRGKYGLILEDAKKEHLRRIKEMMRAWTLNTLNGKSLSSVYAARSGKVGYLRAFYKAMSASLDYFSDFLDGVTAYRSDELNLKNKSTELVSSKLKEYDRKKDKKCPLCVWSDGVHPDAIEAQRQYLEAVNEDIKRRKGDIFLEVLKETINDLNEFCKETLSSINSWIYQLLDGKHGVDEDGNEVAIDGLLSQLKGSAEDVEINYQLDQNLEGVIEILDVEFDKDKKEEEENQYLETLLQRLKWEVKEKKGGGLDFDLLVEFPPADEGDESTKEYLKCGEFESWKHNLRLLLKVSDKFFADITEGYRGEFQKQLQSEFGDPKALADQIINMAEPFYAPSANAPMAAQDPVCYIRVADTGNNYYQSLLDELVAMKPGIDFTLAESDDPFKLTIFRADNIMPSENFNMWEECRDAYFNVVTDDNKDTSPESYHMLPAVQNAATQEIKMKKALKMKIPLLSPKVVALLENYEKFEQFFEANAFGFIEKVVNRNGTYYWRLLGADREEREIVLEENTTARNIEDNIFNLIYSFAYKGRDIRHEGLEIDYKLLAKTILDKRGDVKPNDLVQLFKDQIEKPEGIVEKIRKEGNVPDSRSRSMNAKVTAYYDLVNLVKTLFYQYVKTLDPSYKIPL